MLSLFLDALYKEDVRRLLRSNKKKKLEEKSKLIVNHLERTYPKSNWMVIVFDAPNADGTYYHGVARGSFYFHEILEGVRVLVIRYPKRFKRRPKTALNTIVGDVPGEPDNMDVVGSKIVRRLNAKGESIYVIHVVKKSYAYYVAGTRVLDRVRFSSSSFLPAANFFYREFTGVYVFIVAP